MRGVKLIHHATVSVPARLMRHASASLHPRGAQLSSTHGGLRSNPREGEICLLSK